LISFLQITSKIKMHKLAIFVEGQTELLIVKNLIFLLFDNSVLNIFCIKLIGDASRYNSLNYSVPQPFIEILLVDVGNDERVLTSIKEREKNLFKSGYSKIIGLRDMRSEEYLKKSHNKIIPSVITYFERLVNEELSKLSKPEKISFILRLWK